MAPDVEERFQRIEAILHAMVERENQMEIRWAKNFERAEERMRLAEERMRRAEQLAEERHRQAEERHRQAEERYRRAERRMDRFDQQLQATRKLVSAGIKFVGRIAVRQDNLSKEVAELARMQKAFLRAFGNGRNGPNNGSQRRGRP
jgi:hypothetical protein